jgi:putative SOS response-associated peptidase YedK
MCGRYYFSADRASDERVEAMMRMMEKNFAGQYKTGEILPGDSAPGIISREGKIVPIPAVFGFPGFKGSSLLINARSETAGEKKTFAESLRSRRIVLPASGFYEWSRDGDKTKYYFTLEPSPVIYLCGLYRITEGVCRFVLLARAANESMIGGHDRMPVILGAEDVRAYLTDEGAARAMLAAEAPQLAKRAV